ncbi:MAG: NAD-dependent epimerase/dehydratase family protein [Alphaproteobacteria bacterium]|nr:NAD-dependent epimerase/dehydratase family protein [Alphaproteobacteria bacterium]
MGPIVALTGGTGFVGRHLTVALLDAGWTVRLLLRRAPRHPQLATRPVQAVIGDLDDSASLRALVTGADAVVHAGGVIRARNRAEFLAVNGDGMGRLAAIAAAARCRRFVLVSSLAARSPELSPYAASKRAGEEALTRNGGAMTRLVLRPTVVYGPWDRATLAIFRAARLGLAPLLGGPGARLSFIHVEDLAGGLVAALVGGLEGTHSIDDGHGGGYPWGEAFDLAARATATRVRHLRVPAGLVLGLGAIVGGGARVHGGRPFFTIGKAREMLHRDWTCDGDRLQVPGWAPRIGLAAGFATTVAWYRAAGWL